MLAVATAAREALQRALMDTIQLFDRAEIKGAKRDGAGNLVVTDARIARAGVYEYAGFELGKPDQRRIRVLRPNDEVFNRDAMRSLAAIPVTVNHPKELVDTKNWREHAKGETSDDDIVRDGESVRVPFIVRDEAAIIAVEDGKHELSPGYTAVIDWTAGNDEQYGAYDAIARNIRYNHLAIVDRARGGADCRIGDSEPGDIEVTTKLILVDNFSVETTEAGERAILTLIDQRKEAREEAADLRTKLADAEAAKSTLEGEKAALTQQLADASSPDKLNAAAAARSKLCDQAKAILPKIVTDGKSDDEIRKECVIARLGDAANDFDNNAIAGSFATLAATVKTPTKRDPITDAITEGSVSGDDLTTLADAKNKALADRNARFATASKPGAGSKE